MQGIQFFEYKTLLESLDRLKKTDTADMPEKQVAEVQAIEMKLREIYANYRLSIEQIADFVDQFEKHKHAVRKLLKVNRHHLKYTAKRPVKNKKAA